MDAGAYYPGTVGMMVNEADTPVSYTHLVHLEPGNIGVYQYQACIEQMAARAEFPVISALTAIVYIFSGI